jgi:DNA invertase Pin-like site-specific DNA recombinase
LGERWGDEPHRQKAREGVEVKLLQQDDDLYAFCPERRSHPQRARDAATAVEMAVGAIEDTRRDGGDARRYADEARRRAFQGARRLASRRNRCRRKDADSYAYDVVVVEAVDRLSRRLADLANFHDLVDFRKVKLHATDRSEINALMIGLLGAMAQAYGEDLKTKTKRGLIGKILAGWSAGSLGFGCRVEPSERGKRLIVEEEAEVVRRIFRDYAGGASPRAIAMTLNKEKLPGPRGGPWIETTIRGQIERGTGILNKTLYVGRLEWNRCSCVRDPASGKRLARLNAEDQWERNTDEALRIVDESLWERAKARQKVVKTEMGRDENGVALNRSHRARRLLSGLIFLWGMWRVVRHAQCQMLWLQQFPFEGNLRAF